MTTLLEIQKSAVNATMDRIQQHDNVTIVNNNIMYRGKYDIGPNRERYWIDPDGVMCRPPNHEMKVEVSANLFNDLDNVLSEMKDEEIKRELCNEVIDIYCDRVDNFFVDLFHKLELAYQKQKQKDKRLAKEFLSTLKSPSEAAFVNAP